MLLSEILAELYTIYNQYGDLPVTLQLEGQGMITEVLLTPDLFKSLVILARDGNLWGEKIGKHIIIKN